MVTNYIVTLVETDGITRFTICYNEDELANLIKNLDPKFFLLDVRVMGGIIEPKETFILKEINLETGKE